MSEQARSPYHAAVEAAYFAAAELQGALLAGLSSPNAGTSLAAVSMAAAMESGCTLAARMKEAADLIAAACPANDLEPELAHGA